MAIQLLGITRPRLRLLTEEHFWRPTATYRPSAFVAVERSVGTELVPANAEAVSQRPDLKMLRPDLKLKASKGSKINPSLRDPENMVAVDHSQSRAGCHPLMRAPRLVRIFPQPRRAPWKASADDVSCHAHL
jgi:hypothetical protein